MCQTVANSLWAHACIRTINTHSHAHLQTHTHTVSIHPLECVYLCSDRNYIHLLTPCLYLSTTPPERGCHTWHMASQDWDTFTGKGRAEHWPLFTWKREKINRTCEGGMVRKRGRKKCACTFGYVLFSVYSMCYKLFYKGWAHSFLILIMKVWRLNIQKQSIHSTYSLICSSPAKDCDSFWETLMTARGRRR